MGSGSTLDPDNRPPGQSGNAEPPGHDLRSLGPSDSSDSGADLIGAPISGLDGIRDRYGTGERANADDTGDDGLHTALLPDRVVSEDEAGLGAGLD